MEQTILCRIARQYRRNKLYKNSVYPYQFSYPKRYKLTNDDDYNAKIEESKGQSVYNLGQNRLFSVFVSEQKKYPNFSEYIEQIENGNKPADVQPVEQTTIAGETAYAFKAASTFYDGYGYRTIEESTTIIFLEHKGLRYRLEVPTDFIEPQEILKSFSFTSP